jgi:hypothetical protein
MLLLLQVSQSLTVNPKELTITGVAASNKVYDGSTSATLTEASLTALLMLTRLL